jgi:hypothetical protein
MPDAFPGTVTQRREHMQDDSHEGIQEERVQSVVRGPYAEHAAQVWHREHLCAAKYGR